MYNLNFLEMIISSHPSVNKIINEYEIDRNHVKFIENMKNLYKNNVNIILI
jgi:hypothetical protein